MLLSKRIALSRVSAHGSQRTSPSWRQSCSQQVSTLTASTSTPVPPELHLCNKITILGFLHRLVEIGSIDVECKITWPIISYFPKTHHDPLNLPRVHRASAILLVILGPSILLVMFRWLGQGGRTASPMAIGEALVSSRARKFIGIPRGIWSFNCTGGTLLAGSGGGAAAKPLP